MRLLPNGGIDPQFGSDGVAQSPVGGPLAVQADGKIVAVGSEIINGGGSINLVAARYLGQ